MAEDYGCLPGCLGFSDPEPPNECCICLHQKLCLLLRHRHKERMAPAIQALEGSLKRLEAAVI